MSRLYLRAHPPTALAALLAVAATLAVPLPAQTAPQVEAQTAPPQRGRLVPRPQDPDAPPRPYPAGKYSISGTMVSATTGRPLDRADVTIQSTADGRVVAEVTTGEDGHFTFPNLPASKYSLSASRRGYIAGSYDSHWEFSTAIVTGDGLVSNDLTFKLAPQAILAGTVTDDYGDPVAQAQVTLYLQNMRGGLANIVRSNQTTTDDLGFYEFTRAEAGDYYISVSGKPWYTTRLQLPTGPGAPAATAPRSPLDVAFPTSFYADVTDSNSATPIPVRAGDRVPVNFTLHAVPALHISIQLPQRTTDADRNQGYPMPMLQREIFGAEDTTQAVVEFHNAPNSDASSPGSRTNNGTETTTTIEIGGIAPGDYQIQMHNPQGGETQLASIDASTSTADLKFDGSQAAPMAEVAGKLAMAGTEPLPEGIRVVLRSGESRFAGGSEPVDKDGNFTVHNVAPGTYELLAVTNGRQLAVSKLAATGATVEGHQLKIGANPVNVAAILVDGSSTVTGFALRGKTGASGVMVLLVPTDPDAGRDIYRRDQSDSDGSFTLARVVPGNYTVVAIDDGWKLDWARPGVMAPYLAKGQKLIVPPHSKAITLSVQVQPK